MATSRTWARGAVRSQESARQLTARLSSLLPTPDQQRSFLALLALFLILSRRTTLAHADEVSASALSRFLNRYDRPTSAAWETLNTTQWMLALRLHPRRPRRISLCLDLTSVSKVGKQLPFVRFYNDVFGIHLVVLFVVTDKLKFPVGYRVYRGKGTTTLVSLALELLREVPGWVKKKFECVVLADSGFDSAAFMREVRTLGFEFVVGIRTTRALRGKNGSVKDKPHGALVTLRGFEGTLTLSRYDRGRKVFFAVASSIMSGDEAAKRDRVRWQQESFFNSGKHAFGLQRFHLEQRRVDREHPKRQAALPRSDVPAPHGRRARPSAAVGVRGFHADDAAPLTERGAGGCGAARDGGRLGGRAGDDLRSADRGRAGISAPARN